MGVREFVLFDGVHLTTLAMIFSFMIFFPKFVNKYVDNKKEFIGKLIAIVLLIHSVLSPYKDLFMLEVPYHWKEALPLHMCDFSELLIAFFLLGGPKILFNIAFYWGIGGATMALITPDVETSLDTEYYFFFVGHGLILIGVFYAVIALNTRPTLKETHQVTFLTLFVLLPAIYLANFVLGEIPPGSASEQLITNYWYLMAKPNGASLLDFFPDPPFHILVVIPIAVSLFYLIYLPYFIKDKLKEGY